MAPLAGVRAGGALAGLLDLRLGGLTARPCRPLHRLAGLEVLVHLAEALDLESVEPGKRAEVLQLLLAGIAGRDGDDLVVGPLFVGHTEHPDRSRAHHTARK